VPALARRAAELNMPAVAITDHGNLFGAISFYNAMNNAGIKPIVGMEGYLTLGSRFAKAVVSGNQKGTEQGIHHIVILARDETGYKNLVKLSSFAYLEGFHYKPRIDKELLSRYNEGLVILSGCLSGVPNALALQGKLDAAAREAMEFQDIVGKGNYYLEIQRHGVEGQEPVVAAMIELSKKTGIPLVATNDCHYLSHKDHKAHEMLLCIQTGDNIKVPDRFRFHSDQFYLKTAEEMWDIFGHDLPDALKMTMQIAEMCNLTLPKPPGIGYLPAFPVPEGETLDSYFEKIVRAGFAERWQPLQQQPDRKYSYEQYVARLDLEINVIRQMGFSGYFLIVWDFIRYAKERSIPVGPGRGSAAGSLVAYSLKITDLDPLQYELLFERFLNPERVTMPDIDIDFCVRGRAEVINYVSQKYGRENVSQIITFGTMASRAAIKDVGRALDMKYADVEKIAGLIPPPERGRNVSIDDAIKRVPELQQAIKSNPDVAELIDLAKRLEGCARHASIHAAGVVISPKPLHDLVPVYKSPKDEVTTQFALNDLEKTGMLKMDFLALTTLTIIDDCLKMIEADTGERVDLNQIPLDDKPALQLFADGDCDGLFQFESGGMVEVCRKLRPEGLEDLIALNALYRPGPIDSGLIEEFIERRHGRRKVKFDFPELKEVMGSTFGILTYQEQLMAVFQRLANYSLGEADLVRRAMGKKKREELDKHKETFLERAAAKGHDRGKLEKLWTSFEGFADYAFNRCLSGDAQIVDADTGGHATIKQIAKREVSTARTFSFNGSQVVVNDIIEAFETGEKEVVEIETEDGRILRCTLDHKFYTDQGYLPLRDILENNLDIYVSPEVDEYAPRKETCPDSRSLMNTQKTKIIRVTPRGVETTYNMTVCGPHHNYFANGLLTANSHSACYGWLAYQTAYLKAHYPSHFYAAVMSNELGNRDKIVRYINRLRAKGMRILPPDVNNSMEGFTPRGRDIRFGLAAIKGVGQATVQQIIEARTTGGPFHSIFDFAERVDQKVLNKRVFESLIKAGAFDSLGAPRHQLFAAIDQTIEFGGRSQRQREAGQFGLFGGEAGMGKDLEPVLPNVPEWPNEARLAGEKEMLGFYITSNPLDKYAADIAAYADTTTETLDERRASPRVAMAGIVTELSFKTTKKGDRFAIFTLEDQFGSVKVVVWPDVYTRVAPALAPEATVVVKARADFQDSGTSLIAEDVAELSGLKEQLTRLMVVHLQSSAMDAAKVDELYGLLDRYRGECEVMFEVELNGKTVAQVKPNGFVKVKPTTELVNQIESLCGQGRVTLK
jgi:DNA polymerase-3 subunit alpha